MVTLSARTVGSLRKVRARFEKRTIRKVLNKLRAQRSEALARLYDNYGKSEIRFGYKALASEDLFDELRATRELREVLDPIYLSLLDENTSLIAPQLGGDFALDDPATREYLQKAGIKIPDISQTTRDALRSALIDGHELGESVDELANRIKTLPEFDESRATTIARTELGHASNSSALSIYRESGLVDSIQVHDGDSDAECAEADGKILSLQEAGSYPTLAHPNCVRAFGAVIGGD